MNKKLPYIYFKTKSFHVYLRLWKLDDEWIGVSYSVRTYNSEERALEVLDMIENRIIKGSTFDFINKCKRTTKEFVFKMPEE